MALVDKRYAEALINMAVESGSIDSYGNDLSTVAGIFTDNSRLRAFLQNPGIRIDNKKKVLAAIFGGKIRQELLNLLYLLLDKGRIGNLPGINREFTRMADEKRNILNIKITTAVPLEQEQINRIAGKFRSIFNAFSVKASVEVNPTLVGGIKVAVGDKLYDGSISGKLSRLKSFLT